MTQDTDSLTDPRAIIAELTRMKCVFQGRAIAAAMGLPANDQHHDTPADGRGL